MRGFEELRNADFGLRIEHSEPGAQATGHDSPTTNHEPQTTQNISGRTKPFRRKTKAAKMQSPKSDVQMERRCEPRITDDES